MSSANAEGSAQSMAASRAEALQALLAKLSPGDFQDDKALDPQQLAKISDKLGDLLGDGSDGERRNERGELLNEEGLPIVDVTEPIPPDDSYLPASPFITSSASAAPVQPLLPSLSPEDRARERAALEAFFDLAEAEEAEEEAKNEELNRAREREDDARRRANAAKEVERLKAAKAMQKKMGKALLQGAADKSTLERPVPSIRMDADGQRLDPQRIEKGPGKKVAFAEGTKEEKQPSSPIPPADRASSTERGQTMKFKVVERMPAKSPRTSPAFTTNFVSAPDGDSDDDSTMGTSELKETLSSSVSPLASDDGLDTSDDDLPNDPVLNDDFDLDEVQHQREIALAYYEKRATIGQDAARSMAAHCHEPIQDDWDQADVPLDATLSQSGPKTASKFKTSRVAQAYGTSIPRSTPSTSLSASVLPGDAPTLKGAIRLGTLQEDQLVGGDAGESGSDLEEDDEDVRAFMGALRRGEVTNAGVAANADALIAALNAAYGAPSSNEPSSVVGAVNALVEPPPVSVPVRTSRFKQTRGAPDLSTHLIETPAAALITTRNQPSSKLPTNNVVLERSRDTATPVPSTTAPKVVPLDQLRPSINPSVPSHPPIPYAETVSSHSATISQTSSSLSSNSGGSPLSPPPQGAMMQSMIVESPDFPRLASNRPSRPPTVISASATERKSPSRVSEKTQGEALGQTGKKASRFMAGRS